MIRNVAKIADNVMLTNAHLLPITHPRNMIAVLDLEAAAGVDTEVYLKFGCADRAALLAKVDQVEDALEGDIDAFVDQPLGRFDVIVFESTQSLHSKAATTPLVTPLSLILYFYSSP